MKTLFVTTAAGALILTGGAFAGTGIFQPGGEEQVEAGTGASQMNEQQVIQEDVQKYPEFDILAEQVDSGDFRAEVVENNQHERVIVLKDALGQEQYKSIYVKETKRLKVIAFGQGMVFNSMLAGANAEPEDKTLESDGSGEFPEFSVLDEQIDADDYEMQIVQNNEHTRVIILNDEDGNGQFKSVYMKDTSVLKIIDFNQGMVFRGTIGS